ncbi:hypothetical protein J6590_035399 [Homalodisca vitripennis]|nr:hypothetical protein J6590_035399 [Homalodisca vitripennis]
MAWIFCIGYPIQGKGLRGPHALPSAGRLPDSTSPHRACPSIPSPWGNTARIAKSHPWLPPPPNVPPGSLPRATCPPSHLSRPITGGHSEAGPVAVKLIITALSHFPLAFFQSFRSDLPIRKSSCGITRHDDGTARRVNGDGARGGIGSAMTDPLHRAPATPRKPIIVCRISGALLRGETPEKRRVRDIASHGTPLHFASHLATSLCKIILTESQGHCCVARRRRSGECVVSRATGLRSTSPETPCYFTLQDYSHCIAGALLCGETSEKRRVRGIASHGTPLHFAKVTLLLHSARLFSLHRRGIVVWRDVGEAESAWYRESRDSAPLRQSHLATLSPSSRCSPRRVKRLLVLNLTW